ncbi:unnamed protein product [Callosobruchus maculatus]|uniref:C2H2-type domain-containing protein n=1 Tax=Callosobruchus maculatus TaxID=64391 RepID=A0A653CZH4_CALMS|nr:unnamed protein product [Callosobruchus maculatus]
MSSPDKTAVSEKKSETVRNSTQIHSGTMDFNDNEIIVYQLIKKELMIIDGSDEENTETYPAEEHDLEDNHIINEKLKRARKMYERGEEERSQAILHCVNNESREAVSSQNTERQVITETSPSTSHNPQSSPPQPLSCMKCQYATVETSDFINHWLKHRSQSYEQSEATPLGTFVCEEEECHVKTATQSDLLRHVGNHSLSNYQCDFCHYTTYFRRDFLQHNDMHDIFQCTICKLQSTKKIFVQDHFEHPWICSECRFTAYHWFIMNKHMFLHHLSSDNFFVCEVCSFITTTKTVIQHTG